MWLLPFRATIDRMREQAQEFVVQAAAAAGDHQRAVTTARTLVTERPLSERSHRLLIGALDGAGDRAGAVRAFEQCRTVLADQLGVDPSAETVDVYLRALRSSASPPGTRLPAATGGFVGRAGERCRCRPPPTPPGRSPTGSHRWVWRCRHRRRPDRCWSWRNPGRRSGW